MHSTQDSTARHEAALTIGFLATTVAILAAYTSPATGYELSIYRATPVAYWAGIAIGLLAAMAVAIPRHEGGYLRNAALGLATLCVTSVVALPVLRSYFYYGAGDSMTHLGWTQEVQSGTIAGDQIVYPGIHLTGTLITELSGLEVTHALKIVPTILFPLVFVVSTALCVKLISNSAWAMTAGVFSALLLVPINKISLHVVPHPSSQAVLFLPLVIYLFMRFVTDDGDGFSLTTPFGAAFAISGLAMLLLHPQETMTLLAFLGVILVVQLFVRWLKGHHPIADHRLIHFHTALIGVAFALWTVQFERARARAAWVVQSLLTRDHETLGQTADRGVSLVQLGGSFEEVFVKLFAVTLVFCLLAGGLLATHLFGMLDGGDRDRRAFLTYITAGLVPVTGIFFVIFFADQGDHYFRILGTIMVLNTIVGAVGLASLFDAFEGRFSRTSSPIGRSQVFTAIGIVFVVFLAMQLMVVHAAPYMYQPNKQVSEAQMNGHQIAFEHHDEETIMMGLRGGPRRFVDATYGGHTAQTEMDFRGYRAGVSGEVFSTNVTSHYDEDRYLLISQTDRDREVELYRGFRYSDRGFQQLETADNVNRVQHNGEFELYRIAAS